MGTIELNCQAFLLSEKVFIDFNFKKKCLKALNTIQVFTVISLCVESNK